MIEFTYDKILTRLKQNLQTRLENTGMLFYSTNQKILEAISEELSEEMRYDEYLTRESKWSLAQNITSIMNQTDFFNYNPHRKVGASGEITVSSSATFSGSYPKNISIPKFTQFTSESGTVFCSSESLTFLSSKNSAVIPVLQGIHFTSTFEITQAYSESELPFLTLNETNDSIENSLYEVRVNGVLWEQIESLSLSSLKTAQVYVLKTNKDFSGITLQFGDDIGSKKLEYGDVVIFQYLETLGSTGEVLQTNIVNSITDTISDVSGSTVDLFCTNLHSILGGSDNEDLETIRANAPRTLSLSSRVVTSDDYRSFILNTELVDKLIVWGETEQNIDNNRSLGTFIPLSENLINIAALTYSSSLIGISATTTIQQAIRESLVEVKGLTDIVNFVDPKITFLRFDVFAYYNGKTYTSPLVEVAIETLLLETYNIINSTFKQNLFFSEYYELINSLSEVNHHDTELTLIQYNTKVEELIANSGKYYFNLETLHRDIFAGSVSIFVKNIDSTLASDHPHASWFKVATDDSNGGFTGELVPAIFTPTIGETYRVSFETTGTALRYNYGSVCDVTGIPFRIFIENGMEGNSSDYQIKFEFKTGTNSRVSVIPTRRQQIYAIESVDISTDLI